MQMRRSQIDGEMEQLKKMGQMCTRLEERIQLSPVEIGRCLKEIHEDENRASCSRTSKKTGFCLKRNFMASTFILNPRKRS